MLFFVLLAIGLTSAHTAKSQISGTGIPESPRSFKPEMQKAFAFLHAWDHNFQKSGSGFAHTWISGIGRISDLWSSGLVNGSIRIMNPDRMACLIPDPNRVESMHVLHLSNVNPIDRMPNAWSTRKDLFGRPWPYTRIAKAFEGKLIWEQSDCTIFPLREQTHLLYKINQ